jgi:myo-inositol-1(or 4)-monophosphatase
VLGAGGVAEEVTVGGTRWQIAGNRRAVTDASKALRSS